jgi:TetR/AcrR family transcriptional repressor of bet genes
MGAVTQNLTRAKQKALTRKKLIQTTVDIIYEEGLEGITIAKVADRCNLSRGIYNFHFKTKEQLILDTFGVVQNEFTTTWKTALKIPDTSPEEKLKIMINRLLNKPLATPKKLSVLYSLWGLAPHRKTYFNHFAKMDREYETAIKDLLHSLGEQNAGTRGLSIKAIAVGLTAIIDGCLLQYLIAPGQLGHEEAESVCLAYLSSFFPESF